MKPKHQKPPTMTRESFEEIASVFKAFSDPTRLHLLQELMSGEKNVTELVKATGYSQASVSKHLNTLNESKIISKRKVGNHSIFSLDHELVSPLCSMICDKLNKGYQSQQEVTWSEIEYEI